MPTKQIECCAICRYYEVFPGFDPDDEDEDEDEEIPTGFCRRYPPTQFPGLPSAYPEVIGNSGWCGEFTPRS